MPKNEPGDNRSVVLYLNGQFDPMPPECEVCIEKIHDGQYASVNLKKLKGHNLYSAAVNRETRLIFSRQNIKGKSVLLLIWIVYNHDYSKVPYFKPEVLNRFLDKNAQKIDKVVEANFEDCTDQNLITRTKKWVYKKSIADVRGYIIWTDAQLEVLNAKCPKVVTGRGGAGKTSVALGEIETDLANHVGEKRHIVYITRTPELAEEFTRTCQSALQIPPQVTLECVSYDAYVQRTRAFSSLDTFIDEEVFFAWLKKLNIQGDYNTYYQECGFISVCESLEEYLNFGTRGSLLENVEQRTSFHKLCSDYNLHRKKQHLIDLNLDSFEYPREIDKVVIDEGQNLSFAKIKTAFTLVKDENLLICADGNQRTTKTVSNMTYLWQQLSKSKRSATHFILKQLFRNPKLIQDLTDKILKLKSLIKGGINDLSEAVDGSYCDDDSRLGAVRWHTEVNSELIDACKNVDCAVIIDHEKDRDAARKIFKTPLIFTIEQITGREYAQIILLNPFASKIYKEINQNIPDDFDERSFNHNRTKSKDDKSSKDAETELNRLNTKIARASVSVDFVLTDANQPRHVLKLLKSKMDATLTNEAQSTLEPSSEADWLAVAEELRKNNLESHAEDIEENFKPKRKKTTQKKSSQFSLTVSTISQHLVADNETAALLQQRIRVEVKSILGQKMIVKKMKDNLKWDLYNECIKANINIVKMIIHLIQFNPGVEALLLCAQRNPKILAEITADLLFKKNLFHRLCTFEDGHAVLVLLFEKHPDLCPQMPEDILFQNLDCHNTTIFNYLVAIASGHQLLALIIYQNNNVYHAIKETHLYTPYSVRSGVKDFTVTAFQHLCFIKSTYAVSLLISLLLQLKRLPCMIDLWGDPNDQHLTPMIPLWYLSCSDEEEKVRVLSELVRLKPELIDQFTNEMLFSPPVGLHFHRHYNRSVASGLLSYPGEGSRLLICILANRHDLVESLTEQQLCRKFDIPSNYSMGGLLSVFFVDEEARNFFFHLLDQSPTLRTKINSQAFYQLYGNTNISPFSMSLTTPERVELLFKASPLLYTQVPKEALFKIVPDMEMANHKVSVSTFQVLASVESYRKILFGMVLKSSHSFVKLDPKLVFNSIVIDVQKHIPSVALALLDSSLGQMILLKLLELNPHLVPYMTIECIEHAFQEHGFPDPLFVLIHLAKENSGIALIRHLAKENIKFRQLLTDDQLSKIVTIEQGNTKVETSLQELLKKSPLGKDLLTQVLGKTISQSAESSTNTLEISQELVSLGKTP